MAARPKLAAQGNDWAYLMEKAQQKRTKYEQLMEEHGRKPNVSPARERQQREQDDELQRFIEHQQRMEVERKKQREHWLQTKRAQALLHRLQKTEADQHWRLHQVFGAEKVAEAEDLRKRREQGFLLVASAYGSPMQPPPRNFAALYALKSADRSMALKITAQPAAVAVGGWGQQVSRRSFAAFAQPNRQQQ